MLQRRAVRAGVCPPVYTHSTKQAGCRCWVPDKLFALACRAADVPLHAHGDHGGTRLYAQVCRVADVCAQLFVMWNLEEATCETLQECEGALTGVRCTVYVARAPWWYVAVLCSCTRYMCNVSVTLHNVRVGVQCVAGCKSEAMLVHSITGVNASWDGHQDGARLLVRASGCAT